MKKTDKLRNMLRGIIDAITRFPLTAVFLLTGSIINAIDINTVDKDYTKYLLTMVVGAFLGITAQVVYERFFIKASSRIFLIAIAAFLTALYYIIINPAPNLSRIIETKTAVALFALMIAFIWIPVIKSKVSFNESFLVTFKAFYITLFFSGVIFVGISIIIAAINQLLFQMDYRVYSHTTNLVFFLFAPMYFLSLIPVYPGNRDEDEDIEKGKIDQQVDIINKLSSYTKYLEILLSYIIIPLIAVFTMILLLYIILNIRGEFWTDNLLEPMIVSYSITVILVYILASRLKNKLALLYIKIFPKILVPIVLFQTIASILKVGDMGITHTRYYVILYGIFATLSGILLSILPVRKNGIIAALLIGFSVISIVPPVDAFSLSKRSQINVLEEVLIRNNMLDENQIKPNASIAEKDKEKITNSVNYLSLMEYTDDINWFITDSNNYVDFYKTFGFYQYEQSKNEMMYLNVSLPQGNIIDIKGFDFMVYTNMFISEQNTKNELIGDIEKAGENYTISKQFSKEEGNIIIFDKNELEVLSFSMNEVFAQYDIYNSSKNHITVEEATFTKENDRAAITFIVQSLNLDKTPGQLYSGVEGYILVKIK